MQTTPDLTMPHLRTARQEVNAAFDAASVTPVTPDADKDAPPDPRRKREYTFDFAYTDSLGKASKGRFTNQILTLGQKIKIGVVRGRRQAGVPMDCMSARTTELLYIVGWMEESLTTKPEWAQNLLDLTDEDLVEALWMEVARHERIFRGRGEPDSAGEDQPPAQA